MGLEQGTGPNFFIADLNVNWPVGNQDYVEEGDDHIRLTKNATKNSFEFIAGKVTANHLELSYCKGLTAPITDLLEGKSDTGHDHENVYSPVGHLHTNVYAPATHSHEGYAAEGHNHNEDYAAIDHPHSDYEARLDALEASIEPQLPSVAFYSEDSGTVEAPINDPSIDELIFGFIVSNAAPNQPVTIYNSYYGTWNRAGTTNAQGDFAYAFTGQPLTGLLPGSYSYRVAVQGQEIGSTTLRIV